MSKKEAICDFWTRPNETRLKIKLINSNWRFGQKRKIIIIELEKKRLKNM